jgi:dUTP pyrophosphatase
MKLLIKTDNPILQNLYTNHEHYNPGDSGLDLFCPETITIKPGETVKVNLQIKCEALSDTDVDYDSNTNVSYYLYARSSIIKTPLRLANSVGIIDSGYRGDIIACVDNIKNVPYTIQQGSRLFQLCGPQLEPIQFQLTNDLSNSQRGAGGFGSTGQ